MCENVDPVKSYGKTNMINVFVLSLWEKYRWGLTYFGQFYMRFKHTKQTRFGIIVAIVTSGVATQNGCEYNVSVENQKFHKTIFLSKW